MSDLYSELLVKREHTIKDSFVKYGLIVLTAIAVIAGLIITPLIWIVAVALGIACYFVIPKTDVEIKIDVGAEQCGGVCGGKAGKDRHRLGQQIPCQSGSGEEQRH